MRLGFDRLWLFLALVLPALLALLVPMPAVDLAYQVRAGDEILRMGAIPGVEAYTFTVAGTPWTDQQWLAQLVLAAGYRLGGWELLAVLRAALVAMAFGTLAAVAMARGSGPRTAALLSLLAFALAAPTLALRPQLVGIVIFAALLWLIAVRHRCPWVYWLAPALVVLWANVHGSFVLAPLLLGYAWLDDRVRGRPGRASLIVLVLGTAATFVNPFGPGVWTYAAGIGGSTAIATRASEWQRTSPLTVPGLLFYVSAVAGAILAFRGRAALRWPDWLWLGAMFVIGAWTVRGLAWWPLGLVFVLGAAVPAAVAPMASLTDRPARVRLPSRANAILAVALGLALVAALPWLRSSDPLTGRDGLLSHAPTGLAEALREAAPAGAHVFAPQPWTSWLEWAAPDARYFMDSRFELFPPAIWSDYDTVIAGGEAAGDTLARWRVELLVVSPGDTVPAGWDPVYRDADGGIYSRGPGVAR